jgi:ribonuclease P protein component
LSPYDSQVVPTLYRLKHRKEFLRAAKQGRKWAVAGLVLQVRNRAPQEAQGEIEADAVRVGFTVTKKVGNSVIRNRVRRRLRAVADEVLPVIVTCGLDLVIIGRAGTIKRPYLALVKDLKTALKKLKANKCA